MTTGESVEVTSQGPSMTVVGGEGGPWWLKYAMQLGFMLVLIMVLWGVYDLLKTKIPSLASPVERIAEMAEEGERHLELQAKASERTAAAAQKQADAIERWVNMQSPNFRMTTGSFGPAAIPPSP